jgi:tartrate-resistant acid phosphatase type 5
MKKFTKIILFRYVTLFSFFAISQFIYAQNLTFIAFGDWGRDGQNLQWETAVQMGIWAEDNKCDFAIVLGDNFYETGVRSVDDPQWKTSFEDIYTAPSLQIPFYAALGNHDYGGNVQAQVDYTKISTRWKMPARYYSFGVKVNDKDSAVFVILDTNPFVGHYKAENSKDDEISAEGREDLRSQNVQLQLNFLDSVFTATNAKWKIVCGHHPVYSGGKHKSTKELLELLKPLLEKHKVNTYICGHDHDIQYLKDKKSDVNYFVSGAGSELRKTGTIPETIFSESINAFFAVKIYDNKMTGQFIDYRGNVLFETEIK